eukprot:1139279-Pelagomonas_calceolata.AAC.4
MDLRAQNEALFRQGTLTWYGQLLSVDEPVHPPSLSDLFPYLLKSLRPQTPARSSCCPCAHYAFSLVPLLLAFCASSGNFSLMHTAFLAGATPANRLLVMRCIALNTAAAAACCLCQRQVPSACRLPVLRCIASNTAAVAHCLCCTQVPSSCRLLVVRPTAQALPLSIIASVARRYPPHAGSWDKETASDFKRQRYEASTAVEAGRIGAFFMGQPLVQHITAGQGRSPGTAVKAGMCAFFHGTAVSTTYHGRSRTFTRHSCRSRDVCFFMGPLVSHITVGQGRSPGTAVEAGMRAFTWDR